MLLEIYFTLATKNQNDTSINKVMMTIEIILDSISQSLDRYINENNMKTAALSRPRRPKSAVPIEGTLGSKSLNPTPHARQSLTAAPPPSDKGNKEPDPEFEAFLKTDISQLISKLQSCLMKLNQDSDQCIKTKILVDKLVKLLCSILPLVMKGNAHPQPVASIKASTATKRQAQSYDNR
ncbi:hypothetical protein HDV05_006194 [Chytridiales sp. JEL 0842]|nr:hypothetical protein HDV05_006194 [Chytridiales sp. JEL 0842]